MIYIQFIAGFVLYAGMSYATYHSQFKASSWFFPVGLIGAIAANAIWLSIAKAELNTSQLMIKGLVWDAILMACYAITPVLIFDARFSNTQIVGIVLTLIGLFITKL